MMYVDFNAGNKEYKLRLNTRSVVALEKKIECNPVAIFGDGDTIPKLTILADIFHASLQAYHHGISVEDAFDILDAWLGDGHDTTEFIKVVLEIYKVSGIISKEFEIPEDATKN